MQIKSINPAPRFVRYFTYSLQKFFKIPDVFNRRRIDISTHVYKHFDGVIQFGPFKGMRLDPHSSWGPGDKASIIFGIYEKEILDDLAIKPSKYKTFVDVGAADGYYAVGAIKSNLFDRTFCFEVSKKGRGLILKNATLNQVSDRVSIFGNADTEFIELLPRDCLQNSVVLIDIEGGEFNLVSDNVLSRLRNCIVYIELHDGLISDGKKMKDELITRAKRTHNVIELTTGARDVSQIDFLKNFNDNDRWLVCSEGRPYQMSWLKLTPH